MTQSFKHLTDVCYGQPTSRQTLSVQELTRPHVESFNYILHGALSTSVKNIPPVEFALPNGSRVSLSYVDATISAPVIASGNTYARSLKVYPSECRERGTTYRGRLTAHLSYKVNGATGEVTERNLGDIPIMVKSAACNIGNLTPAQLVNKGEEAQEMGGYFIINGLEKLVRMVVMPRRNYPMCMCRPTWKGRGQLYTEFGVSMRCVQSDLGSCNNVLHYLSNGTVNLAFTYRKEQFFVPVIFILKALLAVPDSFIYNQLVAGNIHDSFFKGCVCHMLRSVLNEGLSSQASILHYIGERFRVKVPVPDWYTDEEVTFYILRHCVCIHLDDNVDKFNILVHMTRKLFAFSRGQCAAENADSTMNHEVLLPGHLYLMVLTEKLENWLYSLKTTILRNAQKAGGEIYSLTADNMHGCMTTLKEDVTRPMEYLLATGNIVTRTGLGLMQSSGFSTVADKLNLVRYISHFRSIHRGAFFAEMRTTTARKLLPEAWGFLCPVHTPDGAPCGLLNHLSANCQIVNTDHTCHDLPAILVSMGVTPPFEHTSPRGIIDCYPVMLDGRLVGYIADSRAESFTRQLRAMKIDSVHKVPSTMEVCLIAKTHHASQYPGVYLFTHVARMVRRVTNISHNKPEMIGTFEQVYLDIAVTDAEIIPGVTTHVEASETSILSAVASLTPYSDYNQSPRNMYQCQMAKQTMATPCHAITRRADNKLYRLLTPQSPVVRPRAYSDYCIDDYPLGTNAVVAVISYTGYDMEDAMVISKASYERGFGHGCIYKSEVVNLKYKKNRMIHTNCVFGRGSKEGMESLDSDGLPAVGTYLKENDPFYSYIDMSTGEVTVMRYNHDEGAYVDQIKILGNDTGTGELTKVCFLLRVPRNPIIGDKFASRHGQKGICSQKWPVENMPFSETGIIPDILFNPHGYPSRMTIGMMIESMAGKSAALAGVCHDATPFSFSEQNSAIDFFAQELAHAGYNYHGTEQMYSGIDGRHFEADIFVGMVYYQRLRHMVSDKFQVRTTGPIDSLTHQPVQGRKRQGGVRFGEMERDAIVAHGAAFVLQDRLFNCSDKSLARVCMGCGSMLTASLHHPSTSTDIQRKWSCPACRQSDIELVAVPYVFKYLVAELASVNIKVKVAVK